MSTSSSASTDSSPSSLDNLGAAVASSSSKRSRKSAEPQRLVLPCPPLSVMSSEQQESSGTAFSAVVPSALTTSTSSSASDPASTLLSLAALKNMLGVGAGGGSTHSSSLHNQLALLNATKAMLGLQAAAAFSAPQPQPSLDVFASLLNSSASAVALSEQQKLASQMQSALLLQHMQQTLLLAAQQAAAALDSSGRAGRGSMSLKRQSASLNDGVPRKRSLPLTPSSLIPSAAPAAPPRPPQFQLSEAEKKLKKELERRTISILCDELMIGDDFKKDQLSALDDEETEEVQSGGSSSSRSNSPKSAFRPVGDSSARRSSFSVSPIGSSPEVSVIDSDSATTRPSSPFRLSPTTKQTLLEAAASHPTSVLSVSSNSLPSVEDFLSQRYPRVWDGQLAIKGNEAKTLWYSVTGSCFISRRAFRLHQPSLPLSCIRINQRMRLTQQQTNSLRQKMKDDRFATMICVPCGTGVHEIKANQAIFKKNFIEYFDSKAAAGIANIDHEDGSFCMHIFSPCDFVTTYLSANSAELLNSLRNQTTYLFVVLTQSDSISASSAPSSGGA